MHICLAPQCNSSVAPMLFPSIRCLVNESQTTKRSTERGTNGGVATSYHTFKRLYAKPAIYICVLLTLKRKCAKRRNPSPLHKTPLAYHENHWHPSLYFFLWLSFIFADACATQAQG
uniref:Uncharacterized protein n=1 Tax=Trypanosoma vivax (strain Y486) TaxID=1055687 RepID=G0TRM7_TRYVY|nr:hypothetical protein, unlikely [Trypanosoma vivax Y486]